MYKYLAGMFFLVYFSCLYRCTNFVMQKCVKQYLSGFVTDLQNVNITLRILFRPFADRLPDIFTNLGVDYDERVLPSIINEVLKAVVVSMFY